MESASLSPSQQPVRDCGFCSSPLCPHGRCRVCSECDDCKIVIHNENPLRAWHRNQSEINPRAYLLRAGIGEQDLDEAERALVELKGDCCRCGNSKQPWLSFCRACFREIPYELSQKLSLHFSHGYLEHYRDACKLLEAKARKGNGIP